MWFNKAAFDNSFKAMAMVYEQNEKMVGTVSGSKRETVPGLTYGGQSVMHR